MLASLMLAWAMAGQLSQPAEFEAEVTALIRRLDSPQFVDRQDAEKRLIDLGVDVLPLLPKVDNRTSGETTTRLARIRRTLEKEVAAKAGEGTRVTLRGQMKLSEALAEFEQQTGNRTVDFRGRFGQQATDPTVEVDFENELYWKALDNLLDQASLTVYKTGREPRTLRLVARDEGELPRSDRASYSGLFRIEGTRLRSERDLRRATNQPLRLTIDVLWEPRVIPILLRQRLDTLRVIDDQEAPMDVETQRQELQVSAQATIPGVEFVLPLVLPDRSVKSIATLEGKLHALIPGREETFEFPNIQQVKNKRLSKAGLSVTVESVRKSGSIYEIRVRIRMDDAAESMQSHLSWVEDNEAYLLDADGRRVDETPTYERISATRDEFVMAYIFPIDDLKGYTFMYKSPAAIVDMAVDFKLTDIPLP